MLERVTADGLLNRRNQRLSSQAIGMLLRNQLYAGIIDAPEYGVRRKRGDFEPIITEDLFQRAQAVLSGRIPSSAPRLQAHPDFPLRNFVRCASCNRGLTGSWSKGRSAYYAYYHCRPGCRGVNVTKARLETAFTEELARLRPTAVYMRALKEEVLQLWKARKEAIATELADAERRAQAIQKKLDRLDEAFERTTSTSTTVTPSRRARSSRCCAWTVMPPRSRISTWRASWPSRSASCRARPTPGCSRHSTSDSGSNGCFFPRESRSTVRHSFESPQPSRLSATCGELGREMKVWWT